MFRKLTGVMALAAVFWAGTASAFPYVYVPDGVYLAIVDAQTNTIVRTLSTMYGGIGVAVNASGTRVYIARGTDAKVSVLDPSLVANPNMNPVIGRYAGQGDLREVAVGPQGKILYVGDVQNDEVVVLDMPDYSIAGKYQPATSGLVGFALDPAGRRLALASGSGASATVRVYDMSNGTHKDVSLSAQPESLLFSTDGNTLWIATASGFESYDLTSGALTPTAVSGGVGVMAYSPRSGLLYVASLNNAINPYVYAYPAAGGTPVPITVAGRATGLALSPDGTRLYVAEATGLQVVDTSSDAVVATVNFTSNAAVTGNFVGPGDIWANNANSETRVGQQLSSSVVASDYQSRTLSYDVISQPALGALNFTQGTGDYTYTPPAGYSGIQSFVWEATALGGTGSPTQARSRPVTETMLIDPTISTFTAQKVDPKATIGPLDFTLAGTMPLQLKVTSTNKNVVDPATAQFSSGCGVSTLTCTLTLTAGTAAGSSAGVTVSATDPSGLVASSTVRVTINGSSGGGGGGLPWPILAGLAMLLSIVRLRRRAHENGSI